MTRSLVSLVGPKIGLLGCILAGCGPDPASHASPQLEARAQSLEQQVGSLQAEVDLARIRVAAHLGLEFLGDQPAVPGDPQAFEILSISVTPDPSSSDYPDCIGVCECARLDSAGERTNEKVLVAAMQFRNRLLTSWSRVRVGDQWRAQLVPFQHMPANVMAIQRVDDTDNFELPLVAAIAPEIVGAESGKGPVVENVTPPDGTGPTQAAAIAGAKQAIEARVQQYGGFAKWHKQLNPLRQDLSRQLRELSRPLARDRVVFRNLNYISHPPSEQWPQPQVAYFQSLRDQLASRGIDLIVVPFPEQEQFSALRLAAAPPSDGVVHAYRQLWYLKLLEAGVEVVDILPALIAQQSEHDLVYYDAADGHPAAGGIEIAAAEIARRLRRYGDLEPAMRQVACKQVAYCIPKTRLKFPPHAYVEGCYSARQVTTVKGRLLPSKAKGAPILVMGDSFIGTPSVYGVPSADLLAQITRETGVLSRRLQVGGGAPQLMVHLSKQGAGLLAGVRVLVYVFRENYMFRHRPDEAKFRWQVVDLPK